MTKVTSKVLEVLFNLASTHCVNLGQGATLVSNYFIGDKYLCYDFVEKLPYQWLQSILFCDVMSSTMDVYQRQLSKP